jgi:hypothetical protein
MVHVSIVAGRNRIGASKTSLHGGPKLAASDDGGMSIILSGSGKGGIDPSNRCGDRWKQSQGNWQPESHRMYWIRFRMSFAPI